MSETVLQNVKSIDLTKLERKIILALWHSPDRQNKYEQPIPEGNNVAGIAEFVYGRSVFYPYRATPGEGEGFLTIKESTRSSLNRTLKNLWKKKFVLKCHPRYHRYYRKPDEWDKDHGMTSGYRTKTFRGLEGREYNSPQKVFIDVSQYAELPNRTYVWWRLTNKGKDAAELLTGITQRRARCRQCNCWVEEKDQCDLQRIKEKWKELDECGDKNVWEWHDEYGWEYKGR